MTRPTIVSVLTGAGQAAIATIGVLGPAAWDAVRTVFRSRSGQTIDALPRPGQPVFGRLGAEVADDVVLIVKRSAPAPWLELHTHGGAQACRFALEQLLALGLNSCTWQEFLAAATDDPLQARALAALAEAPTVRTAAILADQYHGALARAIDAILDALTAGDLATAADRIRALAAAAPVGRHLLAPWRVVIAGAPNVGKSSLINALAGYERSVVSPTPGTTRDLVTTSTAIDGWPVELIDTAGLRADGEALEAQGIRLAREAIESADLCLWVLDASVQPVWPTADQRTDFRLVMNKCDLAPALDRATAMGAAFVSARTGEGLPELLQQIGRWLVPSPPPAGAAVPFGPACCAGIERTQLLLKRGEGAAAADCLRAIRGGQLLDGGIPAIHTS